jgi:monofunctional biosynthetic peptidoglycan transglycosylase
MPIGEKRKTVRRVALGLVAAALIWLFGVWPPPVWWRSHWPERTAMMRLRGDTAGYQPTGLDAMSPILQRMVIIGEDSRFRTHHGLDFEEIRDALGLQPGASVGGTLRALWARRDRLRGASTITQQLAKNLYLSPTRNPFRKLKEAVTALRLELTLPKDRIMELYLNIVELGPGVWGMPQASAKYFGSRPGGLTEDEAAALAATLPFPLSSNPAYRSGRMLHRRDLILARYHGVPVFIPPDEELLDSLPVPVLVPPVVTPVMDSLMDSVLVTPPESVADTASDSVKDTVQDSVPD